MPLKLFEYNLTIEDIRSKTMISRVLNVDKPIIQESVGLKSFTGTSFTIRDTTHLPKEFDGRYTRFTVDIEVKAAEHTQEFAIMLHTALKKLNMVDIEIGEAIPEISVIDPDQVDMISGAANYDFLDVQQGLVRDAVFSIQNPGFGALHVDDITIS